MSVGSIWGPRTTIGDQWTPHSLVALQNGTLLSVYQTSAGVVGRVVNADGSVASETPVFLGGVVANRPVQDLSVEVLSNNRFLVSYVDSFSSESPFFVNKIYSISANGSFTEVDSSQGDLVNPQSGLGTSALASGGYAYSYTTSVGGVDDPDYHHVLRVTGKDGSGAVLPLTNIRLAAGTSVNESDIAQLTGGRFAVVTSGRVGTDSGEIRLRIINTDGTVLGNRTISVPTDATGIQNNVSVTALTNGNLVIVWEGNDSDGSRGIKARVYDANGVALTNEYSLSGQFQAIAGHQGDPAVIARKDGSHGFILTFGGVVAAFDANAIYVPGSAKNFSTVGGEAPKLTLMADGRYAVAYHAGDPFGSGRKTLDLEIYDPRGTAQNVVLGGGNEQFGGTNAFSDTLDGGAGDDRLYGADGADILKGNNDNDTLEGGAGADQLIGGSGNDWASYSNSLQAVVASLDVVNSTIPAKTGDAAGDIYDSIENLQGSAFGDHLIGNSGNNYLKGGSGDDYLYGGEGADSFEGGAGWDWITYLYAGAAITLNLTTGVHGGEAQGDIVIDHVNAYQGSNHGDTMIGSGVYDEFYGAAGNDKLEGRAGNDFLAGGAGDDTLMGGAGADHLRGEDDTDTASYADATASVKASLANSLDNSGDAEGDTYVSIENLIGSNFNDTLIGSSGENSLSGGALNDTLQAGGGHDTLDGGSGIDRMEGGSGNDTYYVDNLDIVEDTDGHDTIITTRDYILWELGGVEDLKVRDTVASDTTIILTGNKLDNKITGHDGQNNLDGAGGNDTLIGGDGTNWLNGGTGADSLVGGKNDDFYYIDNLGDKVADDIGGTDLVITSVNHTLSGGVDNGMVEASTSSETRVDLTGNNLQNKLTGHGGANYLKGEGSNDELIGNDGNDTLDGGTGADKMSGGVGDDTYYIDDVNDKVDERNAQGQDAGGTDLVYTNRSYTLDLGIEHATVQGALDTVQVNLTGNGLGNELTGHDGINSLDGGAGADTLKGGGGNDFLQGGTGVDSMQGGSGDDTYYIDDAGDVIDESNGSGQDAGGTDTVIAITSYTLTDERLENATVEGVLNTIRVDLTGNTAKNILTGHGGANLLDGGANDDTLIGGGGHDTFQGGSGADSMRGGSGNDTYYIDDAGDVIDESNSSGQDAGGIDTVIVNSSYTLTDERLENATVLSSTSKDTQVNLTGNTGKNILTGHDGVNSLDGGAGDDTLDGGGGDDILQGGLGADSMVGGIGNDLYYVDQAGDSISEDISALGGTDTVEASADYALSENSGIEVLRAAAGNADIDLTGDNNQNTIIGNDGNNILKGGGGSDILQGGRGSDTYYVDGNDTVTDSGADNEGTDTIIVTASGSYKLGGDIENGGIEDNVEGVRLEGNDGDNVLTGNDEANTLEGGEGNDTLIGKGGADDLRGGEGNDTYTVDADDEVTDTGGTSDTVNYTVRGTYRLAEGIEHGIVEWTAGSTYLIGNGLDNTLTGKGGADTLDGGEGNDTLKGGTSGDKLDGGRGHDVLEGEFGNDTLYGGVGNDKLDGGFNNDVLFGGSGDNTLIGGAGDDILKAGSGHNTLEGGDGNDIYYVGANDVVEEDDSSNDTAYVLGYTFNGDKSALDAYVERLKLEKGIENVFIINGIEETGNDGNNTIEGTEGDDTLDGGKGNDVINGHGGNDILIGGDDNDVLNGGEGNDILNGGEGNDTLDGGTGNDIMTGGNGNDIYYVRDPGDVIVETTLEGGGTDTAYIFLDEAIGFTSYTLGDDVGVEFITMGDEVTIGGSLTGNMHANTITGGAFNDTLDGGGGNDSIHGGQGNDLILGGAGSDTLKGDGGNDTLVGGAYDPAAPIGNTLEGGSGDDVYYIRNKLDVVNEHSDAAVGGNDTAYIYTVDFSTTEERDAYRTWLLGRGIENVIVDAPGGESNLPPENVRFTSNVGVREHSRPDTAVGELTATDQNDDPLTYTLIDNANGRFKLVKEPDGRWLIRVDHGIAIDFEQARFYNIVVQASDGKPGGLSIETTLRINVRNTLIESVSGTDAPEKIYTGSSNDQIRGGGGNDTLRGGAGNDTLWGDAGDDVFDFSVRPATDNRDVIKDFHIGPTENDMIHLSRSAFSAFTAAQADKVLEQNAFALSTEIITQNTRIIYNQSNGQLLYDADGSKEGGTAAVLFATLDAASRPLLTHASFYIY
jgi:Ca2+-binding RTX toxin-like protein